ncbi:hypothetical protein LOAG_09101 [Loa loa]|uniref:Uncharacterized protein n=1 Tax=Loa loa TaxID=7209 RepID=A0A1S0TSI9_LOALO|nr:hypothetical protein LOAG_09101 [Loa loa]EFO19391.2 hypothetical protein LOAG_09101 [Loa loa]
MTRKKSKASKAKHKKTNRKILSDPTKKEISFGPSTSKSFDPATSSQGLFSNKLLGKNAEERKRKVKQNFSKVLASTLEYLNFNQKNSVPAEVLMLLFTKDRWRIRPKVLMPNWIKVYNKFGRIDGPGFNYMRRDYRNLNSQTPIDDNDVIKKFPFESELKKESTSVLMAALNKNSEVNAKTDVKTGRTVLKTNVKTGKNTTKMDEKTSEEDFYFSDDFSEDEDDKCSLPASLLNELRQVCIRESAAASIAIALVSISATLMLLKRLFIFEKHQVSVIAFPQRIMINNDRKKE